MMYASLGLSVGSILGFSHNNVIVSQPFTITDNFITRISCLYYKVLSNSSLFVLTRVGNGFFGTFQGSIHTHYGRLGIVNYPPCRSTCTGDGGHSIGKG